MTRVNDRIRAPKVRVVDGVTGQQIGVLSIGDAIRRAKEAGLDLVEIAATANPPVCKIIDYGKYKYEKAKHEKDQHKQKGGKLKEVKFRVGIDPHDYRIKVAHMEDFLDEGNKVRVQLTFRNRQIAHPEIGFELMQTVVRDMATMANVDMAPRQAGKNISMQMSPLPKNQRVRKFKPPEAAEVAHASRDDADEQEINTPAVLPEGVVNVPLEPAPEA